MADLHSSPLADLVRVGLMKGVGMSFVSASVSLILFLQLGDYLATSREISGQTLGNLLKSSLVLGKRPQVSRLLLPPSDGKSSSTSHPS